MLYYPDPHFEPPLITETGGLMLKDQAVEARPCAGPKGGVESGYAEPVKSFVLPRLAEARGRNAEWVGVSG